MGTSATILSRLSSKMENCETVAAEARRRAFDCGMDNVAPQSGAEYNAKTINNTNVWTETQTVRKATTNAVMK